MTVRVTATPWPTRPCTKKPRPTATSASCTRCSSGRWADSIVGPATRCRCARPDGRRRGTQVLLLDKLDSCHPLDPLKAAAPWRHQPAWRSVAVRERLTLNVGRQQQLPRFGERETPAIAGVAAHDDVARARAHA